MASGEKESRRSRQKAFLGANIGHLIEWYDYGVFGYLAVFIGRSFFVSSDPMLELISSYSAFALSFFIRPIGGLFFGPLADRMGRRRTLVIVLTLMAGSTTAIGCLPTYASVGVVAPILLVAVRCVQGFSAGGEIGTVTSFIAEYAGPRRRGYSTSWLMVTAVSGLLLGGAVVNGLTAWLGPVQMQDWGWRLPFLTAAPMGLISLYIRMKLEDSPEFLQAAASEDAAHSPLREAGKHKRAILLIVGIITLHSSIFYLVLTFLPTFMATMLGFDASAVLWLSLFASGMAAVIMPFAGLVSDHVGRKPFLLPVAVLATISIGWFFQVAPGATPVSLFLPLATVAVTFGLYASSTYATMSELLPTRVRSTGIAIAYNLPVAIFGGSAPAISSALIRLTGDIASPALFFIPTGLASILALLLLRESDFTSVKQT